MIIEVVSHLPDGFSSRGLVFDWNLCQACVCIELYIACIKDVFVVVIDFYILVAGDSLIIIACHWPLLHLLQRVKLAANNVCLLLFSIWVFNLLFIL